MRGTVARRIRRERAAEGLPSKPEPHYNFTDSPDTREERRTKKFRKKRFALEVRESSLRLHMERVNKWNRVFSAKPKNSKATTEQAA